MRSAPLHAHGDAALHSSISSLGSTCESGESKLTSSERVRSAPGFGTHFSKHWPQEKEMSLAMAGLHLRRQADNIYLLVHFLRRKRTVESARWRDTAKARSGRDRR